MDEGSFEAAAHVANLALAARGLRLVPSARDYRRLLASTGNQFAAVANHSHWVDLVRPDGRIVAGGYGSGMSYSAAAQRALERFDDEQRDPVVVRAWRGAQRRLFFHPTPRKLSRFRLIRGLVATPACIVAAVVSAAERHWASLAAAVMFAVLFAPLFVPSWIALTGPDDGDR